MSDSEILAIIFITYMVTVIVMGGLANLVMMKIRQRAIRKKLNKR